MFRRFVLLSLFISITYIGKGFALTNTNIVSFKSKKVKILFTAALLDVHFEDRKVEYVKSLEVLKEMGYEPYIVEACTEGPSFLDYYSSNVCYSSVNTPNINKGINEAMSMLKGLSNFGFDDDDIIIKLTGRYRLIDSSFVRMIEDMTDVDIVATRWKRYRSILCTGCFAMRYKYFKDFLFEYIRKSLKFLHEGKTHKIYNIEHALAEYFCKMCATGCKVKLIKKIGLRANIFHRYDKPNYFKIF